ncbi:type IV secretion system DNA-binding domain-containing protein [Candidatus Peregrinibacteria bacterium]|nr:type IV secretion system DNA-binding domain-containing protein [Candidatus Peregrinibacteria bacterium]
MDFEVNLFELIVAGAAGAVVLLLLIWRFLRKRANIERSLQMVFLKILIPKKESKDDREKEGSMYGGEKDFKETIGVMGHFFEALHSIYDSDFKHKIIGQDFFSLEYAVFNNQIYLYIVVPRRLVALVEKQITGFYPGAYVEEVEDYNIFKPNSRIAGCYMKLTKAPYFPLRTYQRMGSDPLNTLTNVLSRLGPEEGAAIQFVVRPLPDGWQEEGRKQAKDIFGQKKHFIWWNPVSWIGTLFGIGVRGAEELKENVDASKGMTRTTPMTDDQVKAIEEKNTHTGYTTVIRVIVAAPTYQKAKEQIANVRSGFAQFCTTDNNAFTKTKYHSLSKLVNHFILRTMTRPWNMLLTSKAMILSSEELASLFHFPNIRYNRGSSIAWQNFKIASAPPNIPTEGLLLGYNQYRGDTKEIRLKREDRFRHFYVIGQTGTGKSSTLQVMIRQDLKNGDGLCVIDPHGSLIEDILPFIPRERADDVVYFNPADLERPMGLNLLEAETEEEKDMVALDAMNIMIKLFDEEIFGPRIQDYFRNGCLTLMDDPEGGALTDIVRLFTDDDFQKYKVSKVKNPIVKSFWMHQMAKTGAREKQEMIPYFAAKFGAFVTNGMMRNIIGQAKSAFDLFKIMQEGKILLMNLAKGETGEINSKLLGLMMVSKIQMAALKRQKIEKKDRKDFFLYIDEFQNYVTDSIEVILSEARKYRVGLNIAHQYLAQLEGAEAKKGGKKVSLKDAIFGNVGSIMCYKIGAQDSEYMGKEMAPVFSDQDLVNLDKYKACIKLSIDTQPSRPFSITPLNPYTESGDKNLGEALKQLSRLKYGRPREYVSREILRRIGADV